MYVPGHFAMDDAAVQDLLAHHGAGDLVTATDLAGNTGAALTLNFSDTK